METKDSAVQLLKEWKAARKEAIDVFQMEPSRNVSQKSIDNGVKHHMERIGGISRRLDELAEAAGITISHSGEFAYNWAKTNLVNTTPRTCCLNLPAREQQAIQEWLLIKNEEKTA